ncbi:zinc finger (C3HC4 RING finger) protein (macronuclear) [Tetrahymena thermophila SB210]|uniref:Zinc finger (C3HC4 RING finger) protein n=1 Tax=Tetrahymena thermophila (strain SB210) TaxID=312017 RepID=Q23ZD4_TETTS|nr:zinc finger (C3HC4 RING finger) protein [Tetrahymena thermophila SB210]EAS01923.2 zinc finger (C3HC4 RING finger) protein [Tetrahymena thermophila SB210]|eukprot:XP_001022168.2 zinc finger (C3HC4 RING finger) protein [Tetrahymena thermophila SB210]
MDISDKFLDIKNKLLRHSFQQEREEQQIITQLQAELNQNQEQNVQQIITLEGDKEFTIQNVPVENHASQLIKKNSEIIAQNTDQDANSQLQELSSPTNEQKPDVENQQQFVSYEQFLNSVQAYNQQLLLEQQQLQSELGQQLATDSDLTNEEQKENQDIDDQQHFRAEMQNFSTNSINKMVQLDKFQTEMIESLVKLKQQEFDNPLNELDGQFCMNLYSKLTYYQKLIITQFFFKLAFILGTVFIGFRHFNLEQVGASLVLMYLFKNLAELYLTNKEMNILNEKIEDYSDLKQKLNQHKDCFQDHIDNIKNSQVLLQKQIETQNEEALQLQQTYEPTNNVQQLLQLFDLQDLKKNILLKYKEEQNRQKTNQIIVQSLDAIKSLMQFLKRIKDDDEFKRKQDEIFFLKQKVKQFQSFFFPQEDFLQQPQKQSMQKIKQALLRQQPLLLFLSYIMKIVIAALTLLNCMYLFTAESSSKLSSNFYITLWANLILDHIQIFALVFFVSVLLVVFLVILIFSRTKILIQRFKHQKKLKLRLQSLKKDKFVKSDNPDQVKECSICLNDYQNDETIVILNCDSKHIFHQQCIETWVKQKDECPLCRAVIFN